MALRFLAIDPDTNGENCPALVLEEETGDLLFQGWTVTDPQVLGESGAHSPLAGNESLVRLPARMREVIMEALHDGAAVQRADRGDDPLSGSPGDGVHLDAGEQVRWLPRHTAPGLVVPLCDFWLLDGNVVRCGVFAGDGAFLRHEMGDDPRVVEACSAAFEQVWGKAVPHHQYRPA
jgi:hypothetical protein